MEPDERGVVLGGRDCPYADFPYVVVIGFGHTPESIHREIERLGGELLEERVRSGGRLGGSPEPPPAAA